MHWSRHATNTIISIIPPCVFYEVMQNAKSATLGAAAEIMCSDGVSSLLEGYVHPFNNALFGRTSVVVQVASFSLFLILYVKDGLYGILGLIHHRDQRNITSVIIENSAFFIVALFVYIITSITIIICSYPMEM